MATTPAEGSFAPAAAAASSSRPVGRVSDGVNRGMDRSVVGAGVSPKGAGAKPAVRLSEAC